MDVLLAIELQAVEDVWQRITNVYSPNAGSVYNIDGGVEMS